MPTILTKKSDTPGSVPATANLTNAAGGAELAVNTADKRLFTITSASQVVELGTNPSSLTCAEGSFTVARIGSGTVTQLTSTSATITTLTATSATVTNLTATSIVISNLSIASANITTLTGSTQTLSGNLTLNGGTANGVLYLNGSKVATSGSALTFDGTNFGVGSNAPGQKFVVNGASGVAMQLENSSDSNRGGRFVASGSAASGTFAVNTTSSGYALTFGIDSNEQMRLTSTGLGIGTSSPARKLSVLGANNIETLASFTSQGTDANAQIDLTPTGVAWGIVNASTTALAFSVAGSTKALINSSGNMGIGTTSPSSKLHVSTASADTVVRIGNNSTYDQYIYFQGNNDWTAGMDYSNSNAFTISNNSALGTNSRLVITTAGDVGIGTSSPAVKLDVAGASTTQARIQMSGQADVRVISDTGTGIIGTYSNHPLSIKTNSTDVMVLTASGNVGIGTSSPGAKLDISTSSAGATVELLRLSNPGAGANTQAQIKFFTTSTNYGTISGGYGASAPQMTFDLPNATAGNYVWQISSTERMRLDSSGNLGIGTTSPGAKLHVAGEQLIQPTTAANAKLSMRHGSVANNNYFEVDSSGNTIFGTVNVERMRLDGSGNLGLGVTPTATAGVTEFALGSASTNPRISGIRDGSNAFLVYGDSSGTDIYERRNLYLRFGTNNTERARITSGGYSKFSNAGTYQGSTGSYHELRQSADETTVFISNTSNSLTGTVRGIRMIYINASPNDTANYFLYCDDSTALRAGFRSNGGLANYQTNNVDLSDARTKNSITPAASMWGKVAALEIVTYKYNDQTHDDVNLGVIAQQVESVEPVWVDNDGFGETPEGEEPLKTVYTKDIYFAAIKALQEAMARIEQLEAKVAVLESK